MTTMPIDYAAEYNNRARIANGDEILARMARVRGISGAGTDAAAG